MKKEEFEKITAEVFRGFPKKVLKRLKNVAITIQDFPDESQLQQLENKSPFLLGLYEGIPQTERKYYNRVLPDKITLFYKNIEKISGNDLKLIKKKIKEVLIHEIAHHFGFSEGELKKID